jgi:hypothetical protein
MGVRVWSGLNLADKVPLNDPPDPKVPLEKDLQTLTFQENRGTLDSFSKSFVGESLYGEVSEKQAKSVPSAPSTSGLGLSAGENGEVRTVVSDEKTVQRVGQEWKRVMDELK